MRAAGVIHSAQTNRNGDFLATLPGAYAETLNPRLWNSEDLRGGMGFHKSVYIYGPTQYLSLYPIVFLDSYAQIARVLLYAYALVVAWAIYLIWRTLAVDRPEPPPFAPVVSVALLFFPLLQAYGQREFEVVLFLFLAAATYLLVTGRERAAGALLGYATWFKIWPIVFLGYFLVKRQWNAVVAFLVASLLTLGAAQLVFGLDRFIMFNPDLTPARGGGEVWQFWPSALVSPEMLQPTVWTSAPKHIGEGIGFCHGWYPGQQTMVSVRWAVCGLDYANRWFPSRVVFFGLAALFSAAAALGFVLAERRHTWTAADRAFRIICEVSLIVFGAAFMMRAHYHYLVFLLLPIAALAYQYANNRQWTRLVCLGAAYVILSAFVVPLSVSSRLLGFDFWAFYTRHVLYLYGELTVVGLLFWEYLRLGMRRAPAPAQI